MQTHYFVTFALLGLGALAVTAAPPGCPPGSPPVNCFVDPCLFADCPAHPDADCVADYCGGCTARFFDDDGIEVTDSCDCPVAGQLFNPCGSACPPNCTTPNPFCTKQCVARCQCPEGEVINEETNTCVPVEDCPVIPEASHDCPVAGQLFNPCGSACPPNCTTPNPFCTKQCVARCQCPEGEVINEETNTCVPVEDCPVIAEAPPEECPDGQEFDECGSSCTATCADPAPFCTLECVPRCQCPVGTVLDDGKCIDPKECNSN